jgi:sugar lactone lactonase YvrE
LTLLRLGFIACGVAVAIAAQGCAGGPNPNVTGMAGASATAGATGSAGTTGAAGTAGAAGTMGGAGTTGGAGATGAAGSSATAGTTGSAGTTGAAGTTGTAGTTGAAGTAGGAGATAGTTGAAGRGGGGGSAAGRGGTTGGAGAAGGTGGAVTPHGSAARFICPQGQTYGNPLTGMGSVQAINAPSPDYFAFIEGPVWIGSVGTGTLFFSDNASSPSERIWKLVPPATVPTIFVPASGSNGLAVDNLDRIVAADQRNRRIVVFNTSSGNAGNAITTTAKPNDVIVRSDDNIYFTDPDTGFYRISPTGTVSAAMKPTQGSRPNGIVLSLDENTLYVGDVGNKSITKYTLAADGTVMTATMAAFATAMRDTVDGMCVDCAGNVYAGTSGGVEIYSPAGAYIGTVPTGESSNCTFGGSDRKTMYVTSRAQLKYVTLAVPGLPD